MEGIDALRGPESAARRGNLPRSLRMTTGRHGPVSPGRGEGRREGTEGRSHARGSRGGGFGRGRGGRGDVRAAILILLAEAPFNGYQLIHEIAQRSGGIWQPSPGSVYPALQLLQDEGLVQAEETEGRRVFCLSDAGRTYVEKRREELAAAWEAVTGTVDDATLELRSLFDQVGMALKQVVHVGTPAQLAEAGRLLATTRRQLYRILADEQAGDEGA